MTELWADIENFNEYYQVSNFGRVRSKRSGYWRILTPQLNTNGYLFISIYKDRKGKTNNIYLHKLVAKYFIGERLGEQQVNHKDTIKTNNHYMNLEYVMPFENMKHAKENDLLPKQWQDISQETVDKIRSFYEMGLGSQKLIAEVFNLNEVTIWRIINYDRQFAKNRKLYAV